MKVRVDKIGNDYKILVDGIVVASTDSERELQGLLDYYSNKYEEEDEKKL